MLLWWIGNAILLFVVFPVVLVLANRILTPIERIRKTTDEILANGATLTGHLDNVPQLLDTTDQTVYEVAVGATRYVKRVGALLGG
jgi:hypothetical protein